MSDVDPPNWVMLARPSPSTPTGYEMLDSMIQAIPGYCFLIAVLAAIYLVWVRLRNLFDLCSRGLDNTRTLHVLQYDPDQTLRPGADWQHLANLETEVELEGEGQNNLPSYSCESDPVNQGHSGGRWQASLSLRPRLPYTGQNRRFPPTARETPDRSLARQNKARTQPVRFLDPSSHLLEAHRPEARHLYGRLPDSVVSQLRERTNERGRAEISRQYQSLNTRRGDGARESLHSWREIGNMTDDWEDVTRWGASDGDSEQESNDEAVGSILGDMKSLGLSVAGLVGGANVRHRLRHQGHLRGGGGSRLEPTTTPSQGLNIPSDFYDEDDDDGGVRIEDSPFHFDLDYDTGIESSSHSSESRPSLLVSDSDVDLQRGLRRIFPDPSPLSVRQNEVIEDADPSIIFSPDNGATGRSSPNTAQRAVFFSNEISEECDDIVQDLDATYQHIALARRKLYELLRRANEADRPFLRQIIVSNNELQTREMELANLKEYVVRLRSSVGTPNMELVDEVLDFVEVEERGQRPHEQGYMGDETGDDQYMPTQPRRPWGWRPKLKAPRPRNSSRKVNNKGRGRPYRGSGLSRPDQARSSAPFDDPQPSQVPVNQGLSTTLEGVYSSGGTREVHRARTQNTGQTHIGHDASRNAPSLPEPERGYASRGRSRYRHPRNLVGRLSTIQELDEREPSQPATSRRPRYRQLGRHSGASGRRLGMKRPEQPRTNPLPNIRSPPRARRVPVSSDRIWMDSYDANGRPTEEPSTAQPVSGRSGRGGGPWPWPGPGGPIPDPVAPPYA